MTPVSPKYQDMISDSLRVNNNSVSKGNDGKLWQLLDKLKVSKGEQIDRDIKDKQIQKRKKYVMELHDQKQ